MHALREGKQRARLALALVACAAAVAVTAPIALLLGILRHRRYYEAPLVPAALRVLAALPATPSATSTEPIHVAIAACGVPSEHEASYFGLLFVKSLLLARARSDDPARRMHFHVLTDQPEEVLYNSTKVNYDVWRAIRASGGALSASLYSVDDVRGAVDAAVAAAGGSAAPGALRTLLLDVFKPCASARLLVPHLLPLPVQRVLWVDWDAAALCNMEQLWRLWDDPALGWDTGGGSGGALLGLALNDATGVSDFDVYQGHTGPQPPHPAAGGVNSGVMLWNIAALRAHNGALLREFWAQVSRVLARALPGSGPASRDAVERAFPLPDQDVLNAVLAPGARPEWLALLPRQWNACLELFVPHATLRDAGAPLPPPSCIIHFCGKSLLRANFEVPGSPNFLYLRALHIYLLHAMLGDDSPAPGVVALDAANATASAGGA